MCQNKFTSADVVDTQLQEAGWFYHPSLDRKQAEAIRTVALNYCPSNWEPNEPADVCSVWRN